MKHTKTQHPDKAAVSRFHPLRGLTARLLVFNLLLAVFPIGAIFFLGTYESQLLYSQERAMVQQGRLLASALEGGNLAREAAAILNRLGARTDARLRVKDEAEYYSGREILDGPEIQAALNGRYGAVTRISSRQKSVTLYSAIPVMVDKEVAGVVLVSRSTFAILSNLYSLRLDIAKIFLMSIMAAVVLSILLARTVTGPVGRLRNQAESILDERGKLQARFRPLSGKDEVADLSRALYRLSSRLQERTDYTEDFMADLVHELKNPVAGILSAAELAEESQGKETRRFLKVISREANRIHMLLDDLRELISVDVRLDKDSKEKADVREILHNVINGYTAKNRQNVQLVFTDNSSGSMETATRPDRLVQALLNLIDNAVSFSPENSSVEITLGTTEENRIQIEVADRGPGIGANNEKKIFERWYTDRPQEEAGRHSGLGLSIVKGITEGYGGTVTAENRSGGGALFRMELPGNP